MILKHMKKLLIILITLFFSIFFRFYFLYAADLIIPNGEHLENYQWGALEDILSDWKKGKISTDECVFYGCYVLAAQDPENPDGKIKLKMIPAKYNIKKKSIEKGPYFFVYYIYKLENSLSPETLEEFKKSDWSDDEFFKNIINNDKFISFIYKTPLSHYYTDFNTKIEYRPYYDILLQAVNNNIISPESAFFVLFFWRFDFERYEKKYSSFIKKFKLLAGNKTNYRSNDILDELYDKITVKTRKFRNVVNYYYKRLFFLKSQVISKVISKVIFK